MEQNTKLKLFDEAILKKEITWWQMELPSGRVSFGDAKTEMLGYSSNEFTVYQDFTKLVHPEDVEKAMQAMRYLIEGKKEYYETVYRIKSSTNEYITFYDYGKISERAAGSISIIGFVLKIKSIDDISKEVQTFKSLLSDGETSILDIFTKLHI